MKLTQFISVLLTLTSLAGLAAEQYSLKLSSSFTMYGIVIGASKDLTRSDKQALILKNGKEVLRIPVQAFLHHAGFVFGYGANFEPNFNFRHLPARTTVRDLLSDYYGYTAAAGLGSPGEGGLNKIQIGLYSSVLIDGKKHTIYMEQSELNANPSAILLNGSFTTLKFKIDPLRVPSDILDRRISDLN